jgi:hypothetical protein
MPVIGPAWEKLSVVSVAVAWGSGALGERVDFETGLWAEQEVGDMDAPVRMGSRWRLASG